MQIQQNDHTLTIHGVHELNAANARAVREALCSAVVPGLHAIEIDLSQLNFVDGCGLGALAALYRTAAEADSNNVPMMRLINPQPAVQQIIELTRLHHLFELVWREEVPLAAEMPAAAVPPEEFVPPATVELDPVAIRAAA